MLFLRYANYIRYFLFAVLFLVTTISLFLLLKTSSAIFIIDSRLSDTRQLHVRQFLAEKKISYIAQKILAAISQEMPVIQNIHVRRLGSLKAKISAYAADPLYKIQNITTHQELVMTSQSLVDSTDYVPTVTDYLPTVYIDGDNALVDKATFITAMLKIPADIFDKYIITYKNKTEIVLYSKIQSLVIITDHKTLLDKNKIAYAESLAEKKYLKGVKIDIRFAHGVVCSPKGR